MKLVHMYNGYAERNENLNLIFENSKNVNIDFVVIDGQIGRFLAVPACEDVVIWDLKLQVKHMTLSLKNNAEQMQLSKVTSLKASPATRFLAVGYASGLTVLFDLEQDGEAMHTFYGHNRSVSCMDFDRDGFRLAAGSKSNNIVVWDVTSASGLVQFDEHTNAVQQVCFMKHREPNVLISASRDGLIKFWDLNVNYCFRTLVADLDCVFSDFVLMKSDRYLITTWSGAELKIWRLEKGTSAVKKNDEEDGEDGEQEELECTTEEPLNVTPLLQLPVKCVHAGSLLLFRSNTKLKKFVSDSNQEVFGFVNDQGCELFWFCDPEMVDKRYKRRIKKQDQTALDTSPDLTDEIVRLPIVPVKTMACATLVVNRARNEIRFVAATKTNSIRLQTIRMEAAKKGVELAPQKTLLESYGHRSEAHCVRTSHDSLKIATASHESIKIWQCNSDSGSSSCLLTIDMPESVTCLEFGPYDKIVVAALKSGRIAICDLSRGEVERVISMHSETITSMCLFNDMKQMATGGEDSFVRLLKFESQAVEPLADADETPQLRPSGDWVGGENTNSDNAVVRAQSLSLIVERELRASDKVLCVRVSPDNKILAVSLLSSQIELYVMSTLRKCLLLHGHKLPVYTMSISADSKLLVSGSHDKNLKVWNMAFGDCLKSIFAHSAAITAVKFVGDTKILFSCAKDGKVCQWDLQLMQKLADVYEHIDSVAYDLDVSANTNRVVSIGSDRAIRIAEKLDDEKSYQNEQDIELDRIIDQQMVDEEPAPLASLPNYSLTSRKNANSLRSYDLLEMHLQTVRENEDEVRNSNSMPVKIAMVEAESCGEYILMALARIRTCDLEEVLSRLPFIDVLLVLDYLPEMIVNFRNTYIELITNVITFLLRIHHKNFIGDATKMLKIAEINRLLNVNGYKDMIESNYYALLLLQKRLSQKQQNLFL